MAALSLTKSRRWRVWIPGRPETGADSVWASGADAWVKGGHLFIGSQKTQEWTMAWAPGGWLACEFMLDE